MANCIEWENARTRQGYGQVRREGMMRGAHRVAYCDHHGIPLSSIKGLVVRHTCDNPPCINPEHLLLGTVADNNRDKLERGRNVSHHGERNGNRILTLAQVDAIQSEYRPGSKEANVYTLAKKYGISKSMVHNIVRHINWKDNLGTI